MENLYPPEAAEKVFLNKRPYELMKYSVYIGSVGSNKVSKNMQFAHHLQYGSRVKHDDSQTGTGYDLANMGNIEDLFVQFRKYDKDDLPMNGKALDFTLGYFLDWVGPCAFLDFELGFKQLNPGATSGFGAKLTGVNSRRDPQMKEYLENYVTLASQGDVWCIINGSQKQELRVHGKLPRLFTSYPPEHTLLSTIVLGDFVKQFYRRSFCKDRFVSAIGDSPQNGSMKLYYSELSKRQFAYCTDTSAQDSSVPAWFIQAVYGRIMKKYDLDEEDTNMFNNVVQNSIYKCIKVAGYLYMVPRGLGSGDYLTTIMNVMWRFYMVVENYKRPLEKFFYHNTIVINGDDLIMSSDYDDLDLSSKYATITWAGKPVSWDDMDFCSCRFTPEIHYDSLKMHSVLNKRVQKSQTMHPTSEMARLGGLLRIHVDEKFYDTVLSRMKQLRDKNNLQVEYDRMFASYAEVWQHFNTVPI
jgi:hypothetical protein